MQTKGIIPPILEIKQIPLEELVELSPKIIAKKMGIYYSEAATLKYGAKNFKTLSNPLKTVEEMATDLGKKPRTLYTQLRALGKYGYIDRKSKCAKIGNIKKLITQRDKGKIDYRYFVLNMAELKAANLEPKKDYFVIVEPADRAFTVKMFDTPEEAKEYKVSSKQSKT